MGRRWPLGDKQLLVVSDRVTVMHHSRPTTAYRFCCVSILYELTEQLLPKHRYYGPQLQLVQMQERLRTLDEAHDAGSSRAAKQEAAEIATVRSSLLCLGALNSSRCRRVVRNSFDTCLTKSLWHIVAL